MGEQSAVQRAPHDNVEAPSGGLALAAVPHDGPTLAVPPDGLGLVVQPGGVGPVAPHGGDPWPHSPLLHLQRSS